MLTLIIDHTSIEDPERRNRLADLSNALASQFDLTGNLESIQKAVDLGKEAVQVCSEVSHLPLYLNSYASAFQKPFESLGDLGNLNDSIDIYGRSIDLTAEDDPDQAMCQNSLFESLQL